MSGRKGRRASRRRTQSGLSHVGRSPRKRSPPNREPFASGAPAKRREHSAPPQPLGILERLSDATWSADIAAAILGATVAMVVCGLIRSMHAGLGADRLVAPFAASAPMVVGASLLSLALGVRVPQRLALWACIVTWRRFAREGEVQDGPAILASPGAPDRKLYWAAFSIVSLSAGLSIALLPAWIAVALGAFKLLQFYFVWSVAPLVVLNLIILILVGVVPLALLGLALSCTHHLRCAYGQWDIRATAWSMIGAGLGVWINSTFAESSTGADPFLIGAALPPLLLAIAAAALGATKTRAGATRAPSGSPLPASSDRWPTLLRASIVAVGGGSACAVFVSVQWLSSAQTSLGDVLAPLLVAVGVGVALGARDTGSNIRTIGAFGMSCAVSGIVVGVGTYAIRLQPQSPLWCAVTLSAIGAATIGYATSYGRTVLLARVARRSTAGARMLARLLVCAAITVTVAAPLATYLFRSPSTLMLLAMSLIAVGGLLVIYEPSYAPRVRRARLGTVFGAVAAMILLASLSAISRVPSPATGSVELRSAAEPEDSQTIPSQAHEIAATDR